MKNKRITYIFLCVACVLLIPLIAMQFTDEVNWTVSDFIFAAVLLLGTSLGIELAVRKAKNSAYKVAASIALIASLLLIWINGAVGIIGSENNSANLMYIGGILVGIIGSLIVFFRAAGMAKVMSLVAAIQALVPILAIFIFRPQFDFSETPGVLGVFMISWFFAALYASSAKLFRDAGASDLTSASS
jgi:hypothetical protein